MTGYIVEKLEEGWDNLKAWLLNISPKIIAFIKPVVQQVTEDEIAIAEGAVGVGFATPGDGTAKMAAALAYFVAQTTAKEIPYVESQARALIEIALQNAKATVSSGSGASAGTVAATTPAASA